MGKRSKRQGTDASTPAVAQLEAAGVAFTPYEYEHSADHMDGGYGAEAAAKLGMDPGQVYKTLMADTGSERVIGIVPVSGRLNLKALAAAVGAKKARLANQRTAERESGYVVGGISPFGQRSEHRTVLDQGALAFDRILVSGGKRGFDVAVSPGDLIALLGASTAPLACD
ncbi:YbaK / prolyl-tRNA synthetases associated domain protein [Bifidobacterium actinocoloniiforme DSM 22766]|uniref:Cys-tRNA(Pro)/Cys-tRNA(Cys) deacylase n=1 Tax=Bifidobacterium actinocoloniiforme DSM 22766 TaxID=1437605 RepID=A0A086Z0Y6_9BIFI|nr:Cys-tRNA(Pro) deacylase [Bifidobacterium actinocoloniiforme]AKV55370.1 prolyl-tRNA synthetase [Bifidobacterium actinocoloniiforme DSM 22766]KFI40186.1 YbaK / prolyl-tRNA synthetases associated domain protein [Bifidobacterium actinocoloniiforme DSM 22766]